MLHIVAGILSLNQYIKICQENPEVFRPKNCPHCGISKLHSHGDYPRKSYRLEGELNPIWIPRFFCPNCHRSCSVLPECIPPGRWYMWCIQQCIFLDLFSGKSLNSVSQSRQPSRSTCKRWLHRPKEKFLLHRDALCSHISELGQAIDFSHFWKHCLSLISLDRAMLLCNLSGVIIP